MDRLPDPPDFGPDCFGSSPNFGPDYFGDSHVEW
jgi:hypothetical protein